MPVENSGGSGTRDAHWRESEFGNEVMTGYLNSGASPLSRVTVASLADMGYVVSMTSADAAGGRLTISAAPTGATAGFTLNGVLNDGTLAVGWLVASDRATPPGG